MLLSPVLDDAVLPHRYLTLSTNRKPPPVKKLHEIKQASFTEIYLQSR